MIDRFFTLWIFGIIASSLSVLLITGNISYSMAQEQNSCTVEILSPNNDSPNRYPGQEAFFKSRVNGDDSNSNNNLYKWIIEGPIIRDYDDNVEYSSLLSASNNVQNATEMKPSDYNQSTITFYWMVNDNDPIRTVSLNVTDDKGKKCHDSIDYNVAFNNDDINLQAEDFFVSENHQNPNRLNAGPTVLDLHNTWHVNYNSFSNSSYPGDLFIDFHHDFIAHFDKYREIFGYPAISAWNPETKMESNVTINHHDRTPNYEPLSLPTWFKFNNNISDLPPREVYFVKNASGPDQLPPGHPLADSGLNIIYVGPFDPRDPIMGWAAPLNGHTFPKCETALVPKNSSGYSTVQYDLSDFPPDLKLLGCSLTIPYHDDRHGSVTVDGGDMRNPQTAPMDPIFWRLHKFIDQVAQNRTNSTLFQNISDGSLGLSSIISNDNDPPRVFSQNPFRLDPYITSLPVITEQEKSLFGSTGMAAISAEFSEPVEGVKATDFTVNGSPATNVSGSGPGPYVFIGFEYPGLGDVNVTLSSGNITDLAGNAFVGSTWNYFLVDPENDVDEDGIQTGIEVNNLGTNPISNDTDSDGLTDSIEIINDCLDPIVNDRHPMMFLSLEQMLNSSTAAQPLDSDSDGISNIHEVINTNTDPCKPAPYPSNNTGTGLSTIDISQNDSNSDDLFVLSIKIGGGILNEDQIFFVDSVSHKATWITNGSSTTQAIDEQMLDNLKRIVNQSSIFESDDMYLPTPGSADYREYIVTATLNGNSNSVYWTDASRNVPVQLINLPYILNYIFGGFVL